MAKSSFSDIINILEKAASSGIKITFEDDQLQIRAETNVQIEFNFLESIREVKNDLIEYFKSQVAVAEQLPALRCEERPARIPLSYSQERLWFIDRLQGSTDYHINSVFRLHGEISKEGLEWSFKSIVNRHEVLRTALKNDEGGSYQEIRSADNWSMLYSECPDHETERTLIRSTAYQSFDLSEDYMLRVHLIRRSEEEHVVAVTLHHIASDGWSQDILVREFVELYDSYRQGRKPNLQLLEVQYADYAIWQRKYLAGSILDRQLSYWKKHLQGVTTLEIPTDFARPAIQSIRGSKFSLTIPIELSKSLEQLCKREGATFFMTMLSVFDILLSRYSGQTDIVVGSPVANRTVSEVENLIGFFVNTLVLRNEVIVEKQYVDFLREVKDTLLAAYDNQGAPFEKIVEQVVRERDLSRNPLFQVMLVLQNTPDESSLTMGEARIGSNGVSEVMAQFDVSLYIRSSRKGIRLEMEYCTDLFERTTIERMCTHYVELLKSVVENSFSLVGNLRMIPVEEELLLLQQYGRGMTINLPDKTILDLFDDQVKNRGNATAVAYRAEIISYSGLHARAETVGRALISQGLKKGELVAVIIERGIDLIVALLGVLKAGGAYVPVDPEYPDDRIEYMLSDSNAPIVLTNSNTRNMLPPVGARLIEVDNMKESNPEIPLPVLSRDDLAYVIYTSGSTGRPKAVQIGHEGLLSIALSWRHHYQLNADVVSLSLSSVSFDVFTGDMVRTLTNGGCFVVTPEESRYDLSIIYAKLLEHRVTLIESTPSLVVSLLRHIEEQAGDLPFLKLLVVGSDYFSKSDFQYLYEYCHSAGIRLVNSYGVTEATIDSCFYEGSVPTGKTLPIGRPLHNVQCYILDSRQRLTGIGIPGELYIGGPGVSKGYLNRPDLTADKFIDDPFSGVKGSRLYRTGDLCSWLSDGNIIYLGRTDDQVKIRGYRIELGEVEEVLKNMPGVLESAVVVVGQGTDKRLVAYVAMDPGLLFNKDLLLSGLRDHLPEYMVPAALVNLDRLPTSLNGKVDRKHLSSLDISGLLTKKYVAPQGLIEERLVQIWGSLLKVEQIGVMDNFFELGGHSLLATRVIASIRKDFNVEIPLRVFFQANAISLLAKYIKVNTAQHVAEDQEYEIIKL